jgi:hypothetical protein
MPTKEAERKFFTCLFCGAELDSEEEVLERMCIDCINKMGTGWGQFFNRNVRLRPK